MNSIRIGNDINIAWSIYRCGDAEPLTVSALTLYMTCGYRKVQVQDFKVDGNKITFTFRGKDQANTGIYGLTLVGNAGQDGMFTVDACGAFKLVGSQCAGCLDTDGVEVDLRSDIQAPANGLSAYEIAVLNGFQGTEEEWLASLKQPAVDAAEEADKAAQSATDAAGRADTAAGSANQAAEAATQAADGATEAAQGIDAKIATKQDTLVSGENIKSINGIAIPGAGNIVLNQYIQHYKWATNAATTRKQVPAALRAKDVKISYNDNSGVYHVEQYQVDAIDDASWENDVNWKGCRTPNTPMFEAAGAVFNDETGYYEMNGLTDLTEDDMIKAYSFPRIPSGNTSALVFDTFTPGINRNGIRTNFPFFTIFRDVGRLSLYGQLKLEVFNLQSIVTNNAQPFYIRTEFGICDTLNLRKVLGVLNVHYIQSTNALSNPFSKALQNLESINIQGLHVDTNLLKNSALITIDSLMYLINESENENTITVTVHPDVYAKLTDEANAEWYAVNTAAQAKNISFATTE